jgi:predicted metal-binding protein
MKTLLLTVATIIAAFSGLYAQNTITKNYKLNKITSISAGFTYDIKVSKGNSQSCNYCTGKVCQIY